MPTSRPGKRNAVRAQRAANPGASLDEIRLHWVEARRDVLGRNLAEGLVGIVRSRDVHREVLAALPVF